MWWTTPGVDVLAAVTSRETATDQTRGFEGDPAGTKNESDSCERPGETRAVCLYVVVVGGFAGSATHA